MDLAWILIHCCHTSVSFRFLYFCILNDIFILMPRCHQDFYEGKEGFCGGGDRPLLPCCCDSWGKVDIPTGGNSSAWRRSSFLCRKLAIIEFDVEIGSWEESSGGPHDFTGAAVSMTYILPLTASLCAIATPRASETLTPVTTSLSDKLRTTGGSVDDGS